MPQEVAAIVDAFRLHVSLFGGYRQMINLIPEWQQVLRRAWSIRLIVLASFLSGVELVLPMFDDAMPRGLFAVLTLLVTVAAAVARLIPQPKMRGEK